MRRILVIRLGALGDFFLSFSAFAAIRAHHANDHVTLLDEPLRSPRLLGKAPGSTRFASIRGQAGSIQWGYGVCGGSCTDSISFMICKRPAAHHAISGLRGVRIGRALHAGRPIPTQIRNGISAIRSTASAGSCRRPACRLRPNRWDLSWLSGSMPQVSRPYGLLVPGTSGSHGGAKTWPVERYGEIAAVLSARGIRPVIIGTAAEARPAAVILGACPQAKDLTGQTSIQDPRGSGTRCRLRSRRRHRADPCGRRVGLPCRVAVLPLQRCGASVACRSCAGSKGRPRRLDKRGACGGRPIP